MAVAGMDTSTPRVPLRQERRPRFKLKRRPWAYGQELWVETIEEAGEGCTLSALVLTRDVHV